MLTEQKKALALELFNIGAIKFGAFKLKLHEKNPNAPLSPIYIDLRILRSFPAAMSLAVNVYKELISGITFDVYADVPTAATPIVAVIAHETKRPMITPRKDEKAHGNKYPIDGVFKEGDIALLIDDLITNATSKVEAISVLENNSLKVHDVVVLIDRQQGGVQELAKHGYTCHVAYDIKELLQLYLENERISTQQYEQTTAYLKNPLG